MKNYENFENFSSRQYPAKESKFHPSMDDNLGYSRIHAEEWDKGNNLNLLIDFYDLKIADTVELQIRW